MHGRPRVLVLGENSFPFHRLEAKGPAFEEVLSDVGAVVTTTDGDVLATLPDGEFDVVVDYSTDGTRTDDQVVGLRTFVADGGGYVPVHSGGDLTSVSDGSGGVECREEPFPRLRELVGGHFLSHPEQSEFGVDVVRGHPVTAGVEDFRVFDEPYRVAWDDDVTVLARMDHPELDDYPVLWVNSRGEGRVCYLSVGHTEEAFETESVRTLLRNAVVWASNGVGRTE